MELDARLELVWHCSLAAWQLFPGKQQGHLHMYLCRKLHANSSLLKSRSTAVIHFHLAVFLDWSERGVSVHQAVLTLCLLCNGVDGYWWQKWILLWMSDCRTRFSLCVFPSTAKFGLNVISCNWFPAASSPCSAFCTHMRLQHWMPKQNRP